ncbi:presenilins-associated rhomboid-like protein, mitochondrial isoform X2 [Kryptolebias marmoratus]|uniref:presenilins-associated rhomboid-like protein, mitochondrial isoform X2 n=1 Tax=Kryptolebias marmoratus TaxID=37003 RepID=UPI0018ACBB57|nr:presenilins-associated rhomboid-like protein, mitochondrial isoform X2 [Kryptolebias marmoratus]
MTPALLFCCSSEPGPPALWVSLSPASTRGPDPVPADPQRSPDSNMAWRSCSVLFRPTGGALFRSSVRGGRWPHSLQQRCGFKKVSRKPEPKKLEDPGPAHTETPKAVVQRQTPTPTVDRQVPLRSPRGFGRLVRPFFFTVGFTGCSFGSAAIWQYESLKSRVQSYFNDVRADWLEKVRPQKRGDVRKEINQWWHSLTEGQRTVTGIIAVNAIVFCCWRVPSLQRFMVRYFTSNPASKTLCSPMLLSTFSHFSFFHMAANMYVLWSFSTSAVSMLGREQFMAVYLSAGVVSTFVSYVCKMATGRFSPSLGASGAIMTILAAVCTKIPEAKLAIIFLPMFTFTAATALKGIVAMDTAGLVLGWRFFDHAAHLGGAMFGMTGHHCFRRTWL